MLALALLPLAGCGGVLGATQPEPLAYELRPPAPARLEPALDVALEVSRPAVRPGLASERIAVALPDRQLDGYAGSRWTAPVPELVQGLLLDGLRASGGWSAVLSERGEFRGGQLLQVEVVDFQAEYREGGGAPLVRVTLRGELGRLPERRLLASVTGRAEVPARGNRLGDVIAAFESAWAEAAGQLASGVHAAAVRAADGGARSAVTGEDSPQRRGAEAAAAR